MPQARIGMKPSGTKIRDRGGSRGCEGVGGAEAGRKGKEGEQRGKGGGKAAGRRQVGQA